MTARASRQLRMLGIAPCGLEPGEIGVDLFAGGGGWSEGFQRATGVPPAVAVNHDPAAIRMHAENHPESSHHQEDVFEVDPVAATRGRPVGWLHLSPDCTHFSKAKGGKPRDNHRRGLAWVAIRWAQAVRPRIISLENVQEFQTWGPLDAAGQPIRERAGETFREFVEALHTEGYQVQWRNLRACDFGAPTTRTRLFLVARRDGEPIVWPTPTHGPKTGRPWRTAAECIDWSIPLPSIFERKKPLAEATQRRIAEGIRRYVLGAQKPFLVNLPHGRVTPFVSAIDNTGGGGHCVWPMSHPVTTITTEARHTLVAPLLLKAHSHGWDKNGGPITPADNPAWTVVAKDGSALAAAFMTKFYGTSTGAGMEQPVPTVTATAYGGHTGLVAAFLAKWYGEGGQWQACGEPLHTVPTKDRFGLVTVTLNGTPYVVTDIGMRMLQPRELARAQGFPDTYVLTGTKTDQVARLGNSVCPDVAAALVKANLPVQSRKRGVA